jgi:anti-sigma-K factor RskA
MTMSEIERARLLELAVEQAVGGLSGEEELELERITGAHGVSLDDSFERAAAAVELAAPFRGEALPAAQAARIAAAADRYFSPIRTVAVPRRARVADQAPWPRVPWTRWFGNAGWAVAAMITAVLVFRPGDERGKDARPSVAQTSAPATGGPDRADSEPGLVAAPTLGDRLRAARELARDSTPGRAASTADDAAAGRAALLASRRFLLQRNWRAGGDAIGAGVSGDVIWDADTQTGYLRFVGLRRNDRSTEQYQLWIFDGRRDPRFPVDGGVFDSPGQGEEVIVPIRAKLDVAAPQLFAITVEKPGGVVVSDRQRLVVLAQVI